MMHSHTRAIVAAAAHAVIAGRKVAGLYDHAARRHLRIAAECRGDRVQAFDGDRAAKFGGTLPELYDEHAGSFVSMTIDGSSAQGHDRGSGHAYVANVTGPAVQLYDHGDAAWFAFDVQSVEPDDGAQAG